MKLRFEEGSKSQNFLLENTSSHRRFDQKFSNWFQCTQLFCFRIHQNQYCEAGATTFGEVSAPRQIKLVYLIIIQASDLNQSSVQK
jgi:hypothetical protein